MSGTVPTGADLAQKYLKPRIAQQQIQQAKAQAVQDINLAQPDSNGGFNPINTAFHGVGEGLHAINRALGASLKYLAIPELGYVAKQAAQPDALGAFLRGIPAPQWRPSQQESIPDLLGNLGLGLVWGPAAAARALSPHTPEEQKAIQDATSYTAAWRERQKHLNAIEEMALEVAADPTTWITMGTFEAVSALPWISRALESSPKFALMWEQMGTTVEGLERIQGAPITLPIKGIKKGVVGASKVGEALGHPGLAEGLTKLSAKSVLRRENKELGQALANLYASGGETITTAERGQLGLGNVEDSANRLFGLQVIGHLNEAPDLAAREEIINSLTVPQIAHTVFSMSEADPAFDDVAQIIKKRGVNVKSTPAGPVWIGKNVPQSVVPPPVRNFPAPGQAPVPPAGPIVGAAPTPPTPGAAAQAAPTPGGPIVTPPPAAAAPPTPGVQNATPPTTMPTAPSAPTVAAAPVPTPAAGAVRVQLISPAKSGAEVASAVLKAHRELTAMNVFGSQAESRNFMREFNDIVNSSPNMMTDLQNLVDTYVAKAGTHPVEEAVAAATDPRRTETVNRILDRLNNLHPLTPAEEEKFLNDWEEAGKTRGNIMQERQAVQRAWTQKQIKAGGDAILNAPNETSVEPAQSIDINWKTYSGKRAWQMTQQEFANDLLRQNPNPQMALPNRGGSSAESYVRAATNDVVDFMEREHPEFDMFNGFSEPNTFVAFNNTSAVDSDIMTLGVTLGKYSDDTLDGFIQLRRIDTPSKVEAWSIDSMALQPELTAGEQLRTTRMLLREVEKYNVVGTSTDLSTDSAPYVHRQLIKQAILNGEDVPERVLADYPNLLTLSKKLSKLPPDGEALLADQIIELPRTEKGHIQYQQMEDEIRSHGQPYQQRLYSIPHNSAPPELIVFRGSREDYATSPFGMIYTTDDPKVAMGYAHREIRGVHDIPEGRGVSVLTIQPTKVLNARTTVGSNLTGTSQVTSLKPAKLQALRRAGYDAIVNEEHGAGTLIILDPSIVKKRIYIRPEVREPVSNMVSDMLHTATPTPKVIAMKQTIQQYVDDYENLLSLHGSTSNILTEHKNAFIKQFAEEIKNLSDSDLYELSSDILDAMIDTGARGIRAQSDAFSSVHNILEHASDTRSYARQLAERVSASTNEDLRNAYPGADIQAWIWDDTAQQFEPTERKTIPSSISAIYIPKNRAVQNGPFRNQYIEQLIHTMNQEGRVYTPDIAFVAAVTDEMVASLTRRGFYSSTEDVYAAMRVLPYPEKFNQSGYIVLGDAGVTRDSGYTETLRRLGLERGNDNLAKAVIRLFDASSDRASTSKGMHPKAALVYIHELGHVINFMMNDEDKRTLAHALGLNRWEDATIDHLEIVANSLEKLAQSGRFESIAAERAARTGLVTDKALEAVYKRLTNRLAVIWQFVRNILIDSGGADDRIIAFWDRFITDENAIPGITSSARGAALQSAGAARVMGLENDPAFAREGAGIFHDYSGSPQSLTEAPAQAVAQVPGQPAPAAGVPAPPPAAPTTPASAGKLKFVSSLRAALAGGNPQKDVADIITKKNSDEYNRFVYDSIIGKHLDDPQGIVMDHLRSLGVVQDQATQKQFVTSARFDRALKASQSSTRIKRLNEAPEMTATIDDVVNHVSRLLRYANQAVTQAPEVTQMINIGASFNPEHFQTSMLWQRNDVRKSLEAALTAATPKEASEHIARAFYDMNLSNSGFGVIHPVLMRIFDGIVPHTLGTIDKGRPQTFSNGVYNSILSDDDVKRLMEAFGNSKLDLTKFQAQYEEMRNQVGQVLAKYPASVQMDDLTTARELIDVLKKGIITDPKDSAVISRFLNRFDMTEEAAAKIAARAKKSRLKIKGTALEEFTVREAYLDKLLQQHFTKRAAELGVNLKGSDNRFIKALSWIPKAWREQALLSPRYHLANVLDMTTKSLIYGINPIKRHDAKGFADAVGLLELPDAIFVGRDTRDLSQLSDLPEFLSYGSATAVGAIPIAGKIADPVVRFNRSFARGTDNSFREWAWLNGFKDHLHDSRTNIDEAARRLMPGQASANLIADLEKQGSSELRTNGIEFAPDRLRDMALERGASVPAALELESMWRNAVSDASDAGVAMSNHVHFDYDKTYNIEDKLMLRTFLPFHFFATRNLPFYLETLASNPEIINAWMAYQDVSEQDRINMGLPSKFKGYISRDGFLDGILGPATIYFNPMSILSFIDSTKNFQNFEGQPGQEPAPFFSRRNVGNQVKRFGAVGMGVAPWVNIPLSAAGFYGATDETLPILRHSGLVQSATSDAGILAKTGILPGGLNQGEGYDLGEERARHFIDFFRSLSTGKKVETKTGSRYQDNLIVNRIAEIAQTQLDNLPENFPMDKNQVRQVYEQAARDGPGNSIWDRAAHDVRQTSSKQSMAGFWSPIPIKQTNTDELSVYLQNGFDEDALRALQKNPMFKRLAQITGMATATYTGYERPQVVGTFSGEADYPDTVGNPFVWGGGKWGPDQAPPYNNWINLQGYLMWLKTRPEGLPRGPEDYFKQYSIIQ